MKIFLRNSVFAFLIMLLSLKFYSDYQTNQTEEKYPPSGELVEVDGARMHYLREGSGKPVVFLHGSFGSVLDFKLSLFPYRPNGFEFIALDRPGHGYSERGRGNYNLSIQEHADRIHQTLEAIGVEKPILVGHSLGGAVALAYALEYQEDLSGLILLSPYVTPYEGPTNPIHTMAGIPFIGEIYLACIVQPLGNSMKGGILNKVFSPQEVPVLYAEMSTGLAMRPSHFKANASDIRGLNAGLKKMLGRYQEIQIPWLTIVGDSDLIASKERHVDSLFEANDQALLAVLKGVGHQPSFARPAAVIEGIVEISQRIEKGHRT